MKIWKPKTQLRGKPLVGPTGKVYPNMRDITDEVDAANGFIIPWIGPKPSKEEEEEDHITSERMEEIEEDQAGLARRYRRHLPSQTPKPHSR